MSLSMRCDSQITFISLFRKAHTLEHAACRCQRYIPCMSTLQCSRSSYYIELLPHTINSRKIDLASYKIGTSVLIVCPATSSTTAVDYLDVCLTT